MLCTLPQYLLLLQRLVARPRLAGFSCLQIGIMLGLAAVSSLICLAHSLSLCLFTVKLGGT